MQSQIIHHIYCENYNRRYLFCKISPTYESWFHDEVSNFLWGCSTIYDLCAETLSLHDNEQLMLFGFLKIWWIIYAPLPSDYTTSDDFALYQPTISILVSSPRSNALCVTHDCKLFFKPTILYKNNFLNNIIRLNIF